MSFLFLFLYSSLGLDWPHLAYTSFSFFWESCLLLHRDQCPCRIGGLVTWLGSSCLLDDVSTGVIV